MQTLARHPRYAIAQTVNYIVSTGRTEYALQGRVIGCELGSDRSYIYSIKLGGGFIVSPVAESDLTVGNQLAIDSQRCQHPANSYPLETVANSQHLQRCY